MAKSPILFEESGRVSKSSPGKTVCCACLLLIVMLSFVQLKTLEIFMYLSLLSIVFNICGYLFDGSLVGVALNHVLVRRCFILKRSKNLVQN